MKVITPEEMQRTEQKAFKNQGSSSPERFMENAGRSIAESIYARLRKAKIPPSSNFPIILLCGPGNNGGDAYVCGRHLHRYGYLIQAISPENPRSKLCKQMQKRFLNGSGDLCSSDILNHGQGLVIDGLLGTGFHGELKPDYAELIQMANSSSLPSFAIDIPSGLDGSYGRKLDGSDIVFKAKYTLCLGLPKLGLFLHNSVDYIGNIKLLDFGLKAEDLHNAKSAATIIETEFARSLIPKIKLSRHKYQAGKLCIWAGSPGMYGAGILSAWAGLRSGAGLSLLCYNGGPETSLPQHPPEILTYASNNELGPLLQNFEKAKAAVIGPGLSQNPEVCEVVPKLIEELKNKSVKILLDADALNIFAKSPYPLGELTVLTPHRGEMQRLLGEVVGHERDFLNACQGFVDQHRCTLVLKGAPTFILSPGNSPYIATNACPGMATAGSGDVLSGVIGGLMAQGLEPLPASCLGVYLHGLCGTIASSRNSDYGMTAGDLVHMLPQAWQKLLAAKVDKLH